MKSHMGSNMSYHEFLGADPVVLRELDIKLDVKISLVKRVSVLRHALSSHHPDRACGQKNSLFQHTQTFYRFYFIHKV